MVIETLQSIIQKNVNDDSANVDDAIDTAIKFLSGFFHLRKIDDSQTVSTDDVFLEKPDRCLKVLRVKIGDAYITKAESDNLQDIEDSESQRWYVEDEFLSGADNKIHLTKAISSEDDGDDVIIWYLSGFTPLGGVALSNTDLPEQLEPLLISFATYFYYGLLVSYVKNHKAEFPNMTVWDVIAIWDTWRIHSYELLEMLQKGGSVSSQ